MKQNIFLKVITFILLSFFSFHQAFAATDEEIYSFVNDSGYELIEALGEHDIYQKHDRIDALFRQKVDIDYVAKFSLGKYYRTLSFEQKEKYHSLFKRYIISLYKQYPLNFETDGLNFKINHILQKNEFADINCTIDLPEKYRTEALQKVDVSFKVTNKENQLLFVDLKFGETSMLVTLRNRFEQMVKDDEEEMDWFLQDFEDLTLSNEKNVQLDY